MIIYQGVVYAGIHHLAAFKCGYQLSSKECHNDLIGKNEGECLV